MNTDFEKTTEDGGAAPRPRPNPCESVSSPSCGSSRGASVWLRPEAALCPLWPKPLFAFLRVIGEKRWFLLHRSENYVEVRMVLAENQA